MVKVLALCPVPNDGTSWYRGIGPLSRMKRNGDIDFMEAGEGHEIDWDTLLHFDVLFLQRPFNSFHKQTAIDAITMGLKIWVDFDDLLINIPVENPVHKLYIDSKAEDNIRKILSSPDILVTCSTSYLASQYQPMCASKIEVINNALDFDLLGKCSPYKGSGSTVTWRGGDSHMRDMLEYKTEIADVMRGNMDTVYEFMGYNPWFITEGSSNALHSEGVRLMSYFQSLQGRIRKAFYVCLSDSHFNRSKSNIAWLEATWAGAATIAPNWEEWNKPGVITYSNKYEFKNSLDYISKNDFLYLSWEQSRNYIEQNCSLIKANEKRIKLLKNLIK